MLSLRSHRRISRSPLALSARSPSNHTPNEMVDKNDGGRTVVEWVHPVCFICHLLMVDEASNDGGECVVSKTPFKKGDLRFGWTVSLYIEHVIATPFLISSPGAVSRD